jgi:hypothetical protein
MNECKYCTYFALLQMVKSKRPYHYAGDIPCLRCDNFNKDHSEFTRKIPKEEWEQLK